MSADTNKKLQDILEAAIDLARAFDEYERFVRYGVVGGSPEIKELVGTQLLSVVRNSAKHIIQVYPMMRQHLDDIALASEDESE
jgi:hypothetical protein